MIKWILVVVLMFGIAGAGELSKKKEYFDVLVRYGKKKVIVYVNHKKVYTIKVIKKSKLKTL
jgi:hypothetical protein